MVCRFSREAIVLNILYTISTTKHIIFPFKILFLLFALYKAKSIHIQCFSRLVKTSITNHTAKYKIYLVSIGNFDM